MFVMGRTLHAILQHWGPARRQFVGRQAGRISALPCDPQVFEEKPKMRLCAAVVHALLCMRCRSATIGGPDVDSHRHGSEIIRLIGSFLCLHTGQKIKISFLVGASHVLVLLLPETSEDWEC